MDKLVRASSKYIIFLAHADLFLGVYSENDLQSKNKCGPLTEIKLTIMISQSESVSTLLMLSDMPDFWQILDIVNT